jgi:hypothetical protein
MQFLSAHDGIFEIAYTELEYEYMLISRDIDSQEEYQECRKYEEALKCLLYDPEWTDEKAVSSKYIDYKQEQRQLMLTEGV